ncbi:DUF4382 domain-containing protein [Halobellus ordinarius]|uniref:DUF4382 domain-containing protein n=1 Tax=Halobellus ordinarius TaxID=3075120 RepID=UPI002880595C|nr:DUF4382 domain-containing protein [Halobellus sp. ZY16]
MNRKPIATLLVAALVLLAGCSGGITGSPDSPATDSSGTDRTTTEAGSVQGELDGDSGTVNLYISDEENAISDFEHLNVTITRVGFKRTADGGEMEDGDESTENETDDSDENETDDVDDGNETEVDDEDDINETEVDDEDDINETEVDDEDDINETDAADDESDEETDKPEADEEDESGDGEWVEYEVDNRTVDLTELKGANATKLSSLDVPNGSYEKVFVYVSEVNGTLKDGSDQRVKLPSGKLQLNSEFTVGNGESVDFVFDITAVKAGNSGKYILKPVISESGTDVEIESVDEDDADDDETDGEDAEDAAEEREERAESALNATFSDDVAPGENATLVVTQNGSAVANATVSVDETAVGTTDANGELVVQVPEDAEELEVTVTYEDAETELEVEFEEDEEQAAADDEQSDEEAAGADETDGTETAAA